MMHKQLQRNRQFNYNSVWNKYGVWKSELEVEQKLREMKSLSEQAKALKDRTTKFFAGLLRYQFY